MPKMLSRSQKLEKAIHDYLIWMESERYAETTCSDHKQGLKHFHDFTDQRKISWDAVFSYDTFESFRKKFGHSKNSASVRGLSRFLYKENRIKRPIERPARQLPQLFEEYMVYYQRVRGVGTCWVREAKATLTAFNEYLKNKRIGIASIKIEAIDAFLAEHNRKYGSGMRRRQRSNIRGFLRYLYGVRGVIEIDLASLLVGPPDFAQDNPPKFLRPDELKLLLDSLPTESPKDLRTAAMLHVACFLGLRPREISLIRLDDISFCRGEITMTSRKGFNPIRLPLPEIAIKTIAAYIVGGRPKSDRRELFLNLVAPYGPIRSKTVSSDISAAMRRAKLRSSAYWLRHTYAQNLLESGSSIFEIKEMLGHDSIETSRRYIHIHTELMRKVLFDETV